MDYGITNKVKEIVSECVNEYSLTLSSSLDRHCVIKYAHDKIMEYMPIRDGSARRVINESIAEAFDIKMRQYHYVIAGDTKNAYKIESTIKHWDVDVFSVGSKHIVRSIEWYKNHAWILKDQGLIDDNGVWTRERYIDKLNMCGKTVTIVSKDNNKVHIAQDCGIFEWDLIELMGGNYERLGTSTTSEVR